MESRPESAGERYARLQAGQSYVAVSESAVGGYMVDNNYATNKEQQMSLSLYTPISTPLNVFVTGSFTDVEITSESYIHFITDIWIELTITNSGAGAINLVPSPYLFQRVEIFFGSNILQQFYGWELWNYVLMSYTNEQLATLSGVNTGSIAGGSLLMNFDPTTMGPSVNTIAAGETRTVVLLLPKTCISSSLFLPSLKGGRIKVRSYFNSGNPIYITTSPQKSNADLTAMRLYANGYRLDSRIFTPVENFYKQNKVVTKFSYSRQQQSNVTFSNNTEVQTPLNSFLGSYSFLTAWVTLASPLGEQYLTHLDAVNWSLITSSGQPVFSTTNIPKYVFSNLLECNLLPTFTGSVANGQIAFYNFSEAPLTSLTKGINLGSIYMNGLFLLRVQAGPAVGNVSGLITIIASQLAVLLQDSGTLTAYYL